MYYYNNELPPQQGWICPKCGRVNAPWMPTCGCVSTQTTGIGTAYLVETSSISRDSHEIAEQTEPNSSEKPNNCDEPQYEMGMGTLKCDNCSEYGSFKCAKCDGEMYFKRLEPKDEPQTKMPCYGCEFSKPKYMEYECLRGSCKYETEPQTERSSE